MILPLSRTLGPLSGLRNAGLSYDDDALAYFARIATAGGTITTGEKTAANNYIVQLKEAANGTPWNDMVEIWEKICLDPTAARVKLKHPVGSPAVITTNNIVSGDFKLHGIQMNGSNTFVQTGFIPSAHLTAGSQSYGVFTLGNAAGGGFGTGTTVALGAGADVFLAYSGAQALLQGVTVNGAKRTEGYHIVTTTASGGAQYQHTLASVFAAGTPTTPGGTQVELGRYFGTFYFNARIGGYFVGRTLTGTQRTAIITARESLMGWVNNEARTTVAYANVLVCWGDSVTEGHSATDEAHEYPSLLAVSLGMTLANTGIGGACLIGSNSPIAGECSLLSRVGQEAPSLVTEQFGINDAGGIQGPTTAAEFQAGLELLVARTIRCTGLTVSSIVLGTMNYVTEAGGTYPAQQPLIAQATRNAATSTGTILADCYALMAPTLSAGLLQDPLHPNNAGHQVIANSYIAVLP